MSSLNGGNPPPFAFNNTFTPNTDFYSYINNSWLKQIHLPPYDGSYSVSEEIEDDIRNKLLDTIHELRISNPNNSISKLATSFLQFSHQKNSIHTLHSLLSKIDCMKSKEDIGSMIGELNRIQSSAPISIIVSGDSYKTSKCCLFLVCHLIYLV